MHSLCQHDRIVILSVDSSHKYQLSREMHSDEQNVSYPQSNNLHLNTTLVRYWHFSCRSYLLPSQQILSPQLEEGIR